MTDLDSIKKTLVGISAGDTLLETLLEFERTLDNVELFSYQHWIYGELVSGPELSRYWMKTVWMYPASKMPDPDGGLRLTKIGAKVNFKKGHFKRPVKVKGPQDWVNPETKRAKMLDTEVWLVTIELPLKYINYGLEQTDNIIQADIDKTNAELAGEYDEEEPVEEPVPDDMGQSEMAADTGMAPEEEQ